MDEVGVLVDTRPRAQFILQVLDMELAVGRVPMGLDRGKVDADDAGTGKLLGHWAEQLVSSRGIGHRQVRGPNGFARRLTILRPQAHTGAEVDDLVGAGADGGEDELALEDVVDEQPVLDALAGLLGVVVGHAVAALQEALVAPAKESELS